MPKNTSNKGKSDQAKPVKIFNPSLASSPETSQPADKLSKSSTVDSPDLAESKASFSKLLHELTETPSTEQPDSEVFSDQATLFQPQGLTQSKSDPIQLSQQAEEDQHSQADPQQEQLLEVEEEDLTQGQNSSQAAYHLLIVPPEGSLVGETHDTPQETLAAILRHSQAPLLLDELDAWGIHVFYGKRVELLGDIRTGRVALSVDGQTHVLDASTDLARTLPGTFQPVNELSDSLVPETPTNGSMDFSMFEREDRLF